MAKAKAKAKAKALAPQHQHLLLLQQIHQHQPITRFPSNIDSHLLRPIKIQQHQNPNSSILRPNSQMAYQDAWRVCHPDFKRPFSSLEDASERLLPYHVVADYEAEEDDRILDFDTTGQTLSRSQHWDHNIANKVAELTATFEKQVLAFNLMSQKQAIGEFRSEERLMLEQVLLQEERRALFEAKAEMETRQKVGQAASLHIAAMGRAESQAHTEMMARGPIRASAMGAHEVVDPDPEVNPDDMMNGWVNNIQGDEKEACEDFLNDEEKDNGDLGIQSGWHGYDLNTR